MEALRNSDFNYLMYQAQNWLQLVPKGQLDTEERQIAYLALAAGRGDQRLRNRKGTGH